MNLLFDLDGTLTDPKEGIIACIKHALLTLDQPVPDDSYLERFIGPPLRVVFEELLPTHDVSAIDAAVANYRDRFTMVGMYQNVVYDGIPEALKLLSARGVRLFVATSKPAIFAERILEHFGLIKHFDAIYGSELDGIRSDKSELIAYVLSTACLSPVETVMVGDRSHDVVGAIENNVFPAGVLWGYGSRNELTEAGVRRLLEAPYELHQFID